MFGFFKNKGTMLGAPVNGKAVPISQVSDPTFGEEILGKGVAIIPTDGKVYAPVDGEISMMFDTLHAFSMTSTDGIEILVHIGLDTVSLKGEPFKAHVEAGATVKKGDLVLTADLDAIKSAGLDTITPIIICNTDDYLKVEGFTGKEVQHGDDILKVVQK